MSDQKPNCPDGSCQDNKNLSENKDQNTCEPVPLSIHSHSASSTDMSDKKLHTSGEDLPSNEEGKNYKKNTSNDCIKDAKDNRKQSVNVAIPHLIGTPIGLACSGSEFVSAVGASPPSFVSMDQIMKASDQIVQASNYYSDMALVHEIAVNDEFTLKKITPSTNVEKQVTEVVHKAFWDILDQQLKENPPNYTQATVLLKEIKGALKNLLFLPHHENMRKYIDENLDVDYILHQLEHDAFDQTVLDRHANFIITVMSKLCAPARDDKIKELRTLKEVIPLYKGILETLDLMKIDMANFTIQQMKPTILQHSINYEKEKFQNFLKSLADSTPPIDGLQLTKLWLKTVCVKIKTSAPEKKFSNAEIIAKAFLEIFHWDSSQTFPETLVLDKERILTMKDRFMSVVIIGSVLLLSYSIVGESIQGIQSLKDELKKQLWILLESSVDVHSKLNLKTYLESAEVQIIKEVNNCLVEHGYPPLSEAKKTALAQIKCVESEDHSVRRLIYTRTLEFFESVAMNGASNIFSSAMVKIPLGLSAFNSELTELAIRFFGLVTHNNAVFGDYYVEIITEIMQNL